METDQICAFGGLLIVLISMLEFWKNIENRSTQKHHQYLLESGFIQLIVPGDNKDHIVWVKIDEAEEFVVAQAAMLQITQDEFKQGTTR